MVASLDMEAVRVTVMGFRNDGGLTTDNVERAAFDASAALAEAPNVGVFLDALEDIDAATRRRRIDLSQAIQRGARVFLFAGPTAGQGLQTPLGRWLQDYLGVSLQTAGPFNIRSRAQELIPYFREHLAYLLINPLPQGTQVLAEGTLNGDEPVGGVSVRFPKGSAEIIFAPISEGSLEDEALHFIDLLPAEAYPEYLDDLELGSEHELRKRLTALKEQADQTEAELDRLHTGKRILYYAGIALQQEVVRFLAEELEIPARLESGVDEDFRLLLQREEGEWCLGEVKGVGKGNVTRGHVGALAAHRSTAGKPDNFPGLLLVNTFHRAESLEERDRPVDGGVASWAAAAHILILRTLDLVRLKKLSAQDHDAVDRLCEVIRSGGGGWYEIDASLNIMRHG